MKTNSLLFCFTLFLIGCQEDNSSIDTGSDRYLPLEVGKTWIFRSLPQNNNDRKTFRRVIAEVNLDNRIYAQVVSGWHDAEEVINDTVYYRVDDKGFVYSRRKYNDTEENKFRLNAEDGDTWTYPIENNDLVAITLSVVDVELKIKRLQNCKAYFRDVSPWVDEEYTITLAKGLGFVKEYSNAWGMGSDLESATINGRKFNF